MDRKVLWGKYNARRTQRLRNELVVEYQPLVKSIARRVKDKLPPMVELDDLISYGNFGLIEAIERFDMDRGFQFETFAVKRIQGSIYDGIRAMDWVPRAVRLQNRQLDAAINEFVNRHDRQPTDQEILAALGWDEAKLQKVREEASGDIIIALDSPLPGYEERTTVADLISDPSSSLAADLEIAEIKENLAEAITQLPERDKVILGLYYHERLKFSEIAKLFQVSESRICQIHISAIEEIKKMMQ